MTADRLIILRKKFNAAQLLVTKADLFIKLSSTPYSNDRKGLRRGHTDLMSAL